MAGDLESVVAQLRAAVRALRRRGLKQATKFASELLLGVPEDARQAASERVELDPRDPRDDDDRYDAARASLECGEFLRAHHMLGAAPEPGAATRFLSLYALFLAGEKVKDEKDLQTSVAPPESRKALELPQVREGTNPHLKSLYDALLDAHRDGQLDGFGLYLFALVLQRLGYTTVTGTLAHDATDRESELDPWGRAEAKSEEPSRELTTRAVLIESIRRFPWNWSAWMELAANSPFTTNEEEVTLSNACPWMFHLFQAHVLLDQQQLEAADQVLRHVAVLFPHSTYVLAQQAMVSYHDRDFDRAQEQFEQLAIADPHRIDSMDIYSNVLFVKEDKAELSKLAHHAIQVEKYCPETCCIIGNYYSLKGKHDRAIVYFQRALKLDPKFLSAWTLIGHEFLEKKNPSAAVEAYRRGLSVNPRDYRAWYGLGQAYEILQMYLYSLYYFKKASAIRPYDARMWSAMGTCYMMVKKHEEAIACFERALNNGERESIASFNLGLLYGASNASHKSAAYYQLFLGLRDLESIPRHNGNAGSHEEAAILSVAHVSPDSIPLSSNQSSTALLALAKYYKQLGRFADARVFCHRLQDVTGPSRDEARLLITEMEDEEKQQRSAQAFERF